MRTTRLALGALMLSAAALATAPALAHGMRTDVRYDTHKPCHYYLHHDLPGPKRCHRAFQDAFGPDVYLRGGMVYRDSQAFAEFRERGGFRDYDRWAEREESREREEYGSRYAENTPPDRDEDDRSDEQASGGASYGHRSEPAESPSGGASYGRHMEKPQPYSGGASGY